MSFFHASSSKSSVCCTHTKLTVLMWTSAFQVLKHIHIQL